MIDLVRLQDDWVAKLKSEPALERINVISLRKEVIANRVDFSLLTKTARAGRMGCGAVVEMPTFDVPSASAPGPTGAFELTTIVAEMPTINMSATTGTLQSAESVAMMILDIGHSFFMRDVAHLAAAKQALEPAPDFSLPGHVAYRVRFGFLGANQQTARVQVPTISEEALQVTLTCGTAGADIYYTTDDSFPGAGNPAAQRYGGAFRVAAGTVLRVAGYKPGMTGSDVDRATINQ